MYRAAFAFFVLLVAPACSRGPAPKEYELRGQILQLVPERAEVTIKHGDIKGFMPGMTMPFKVEDAGLLADKQPGDLVTATLVVGEVDAHLSTLTKTGHTPLTSPPPAAAPPILQPGEALRDAPLVDQDGKPRSLSSLKGHRIALTFIYTRCPLPDFCPLMDRHFKAIQAAIQRTPALADVRLVSVTLDPDYDTPPVLKRYATALGANPAVWSYVTGTPADISAFGSQLGIYVERSPQDPVNIVHNLRTAVIDPAGRLVTAHTGNMWTPAELIADLEATAPAPAR